ncbi:MAG: adenine phosphoribosyltransferase [Spirochaetales bacterium]
MNLDSVIRKVPDFPKAGILYYDITSILMNPEALSYCIDQMVERYFDADLGAVAAIESRGFLFATPFALRLGIPVILVRKSGKLPGETYKKTYELEYGEDTIEIHKSDLPADQNILIVDDLVATGGTIAAAAALIEEAGSRPLEAFSVVGLPFLEYQERVAPLSVYTLINYESE